MIRHRPMGCGFSSGRRRGSTPYVGRASRRRRLLPSHDHPTLYVHSKGCWRPTSRLPQPSRRLVWRDVSRLPRLQHNRRRRSARRWPTSLVASLPLTAFASRSSRLQPRPLSRRRHPRISRPTSPLRYPRYRSRTEWATPEPRCRISLPPARRRRRLLRSHSRPPRPSWGYGFSRGPRVRQRLSRSASKPPPLVRHRRR